MIEREPKNVPEDLPSEAPGAPARTPLAGLAVVLSLLVGAIAGIMVYRYTAASARPQTAPPARVAAPGAANQPAAEQPAASGRSELKRIDCQLVNGNMQVTMFLDQPVPYDAHRLDQPDRVYIDLHGARLSPELAGKTMFLDKAGVSRIRLAQTQPDTVRAVLDLEKRFNYSVASQTNPTALVVKLTPWTPRSKRRPAGSKPEKTPQS
ncbi:MAG TPA: AMIN domain-containing protein [Terriglobales bacterium]|jgi:hypothetical protein|nr:AMIN domain-containing protein [Terriglobales bacterium]